MEVAPGKGEGKGIKTDAYTQYRAKREADGVLSGGAGEKGFSIGAEHGCTALAGAWRSGRVGWV